MSTKLSIGGKPSFILGVNYWSRAGGPRMWERGRFDEQAVRAELAQMRAVGLNTCRCFSFVPTFCPSPPAVDEGALERLGRFLDHCGEQGMAAIPSFLVGHMSGENYDFPGQGGRCLYDDPELLRWQQALVHAVARVGAGSGAVVAYLASNEMPLWGGKDRSPDTIASWGAGLRAALARHDDARPFGLGDGVMNLKGGQNGFDAALLARRSVVDFLGPHTYYTDMDPLRQALNAEFCVRSLTSLGLPVLLEEFGCSSTQASEENQRLYYREVLHGCLTCGAAGALGWCYSDFDLADEPPYVHHAFELGFGITRSDGTEKLVCQELRELSRLIERVDYTALQPPRPRAAILTPSYFNTSYPFSWEDRDRMRRTLLQCYTLCALAGIEAELVPEGDDLSRHALILVPSTQKLRSPTWGQLREAAHSGCTVYWSYFHGDHPFHQGAWCAGFEELTGCRHGLRYGCYDLPRGEFTLRGHGLDTSVNTNVGAGPYSRCMLPVEPLGARVLATDGAGRPALLEQAHGSGRVVFLNHPVEHYLAQQWDALPFSGVLRLYRMLAGLARVELPVQVSDAAVQPRLVGAGGDTLLWLFNHSWDPVACTVQGPAGTPIHGTPHELSEGACTVEMGPKQVNVYRLRGV